MLLMNKDIPVLWFDPQDMVLHIINEEMLPYQLRDNLVNSENIKSIPEGIRNYDKIRHFFASRVLSLSRDNAKQILESIQNNQRLTEEDSYQLSLLCRGISINDSFWVKEDNESVSFKDINIRTRKLSDIVFQISMKGAPISIEHSLLAADINTSGMFRKTWVRDDTGLWLYKSDRTDEKINTMSELLVSKYLEKSNVRHISYCEETKDDVFCCKCKCATNDNYSFVESEYIKEYFKRTNQDFNKFIFDNFRRDFANMVVCDYLFANPDEHSMNWGFGIDTDSNKIIGLFPLFDNNQALIALSNKKEKEFDELIYDPTGITTLDSVKEWAQYSDIGILNLPDYLTPRWELINQYKKEKEIFKARE